MTEVELLSKYKQCSKCSVYKLFTEFHKRKGSSDGLRDQCKDCKNEITKAREHSKKEDAEWYTKYLEGKRYHNNQIRSRDGHTEERDPEKLKEYQYNFYQSNPEKKRAHSILNYHIKKWSIIRSPCQICGEQKTEGHHEDYDKPLDVIWLCIKHHKEIHRKFNTIRERLGLPEHDRQL